ncbi:MAG: ATP-binding protein [Chloroflexota bacterium]
MRKCKILALVFRLMIWPFVFDRFHRVDSHKKLAAGTGLGLAITKAPVEAHNGRIVVNSEEGQGSLFSAYLPILQQPLAELTENKNGSRVNLPFPHKTAPQHRTYLLFPIELHAFFTNNYSCGFTRMRPLQCFCR